MDASDTYTHELNSENKYSNILIILFSTCRRWKTFIITFLQYVELSQNYATYDWKAMKGIFHRTHYYLNAFIGQYWTTYLYITTCLFYDHVTFVSEMKYVKSNLKFLNFLQILTTFFGSCLRFIDYMYILMIRYSINR